MKKDSPDINREGGRKDPADKVRRLPVITREGLRKMIREALSPTFLVILLASALLWYASRLSDEYTTDMQIGIRIDGQKYRITATVSGRGSAILAQKLSLKRKLSFALDELSSRPSRETAGALTITPASLTRVINAKISDLTIMEVVEAPEFVPDPIEAAGADAVGAKKDDGGSVAAGETPKERRQRERLERKEARIEAREARQVAKEARRAEEKAARNAEDAAQSSEKEAGGAKSK